MGPEDPANRETIAERNAIALGEGPKLPPTSRRRSLGRRARRFAVPPILGAILCVTVLFLSSAVPSPGSWHSSPPTTLTPAASSGTPPASSFYPYLANASEYPSPDSFVTPTVSSPAVLDASSGCQGATSVPLGDEYGGSWIVAGSLPPNGCRLFTMNMSQSYWSWYSSGVWINVMESDSAILGPTPAISLYGTIGSTPGPSNYVQHAADVQNGRAIISLRFNQSADNVWGGWGSYQFALVASGASYGSYCVDFVANNVPDNFTISCPAHVLDTQAAVAPGPAALSAAFTSPTSGGCAPYSFDWTFGDGSSSTLASVNHTYASAGVYTATLTTRDSCGDSAQSQLTIDVFSGTAPLQLSDPRLASVVTGAGPEFVLIDAATVPSGVSYLLFQTGLYDSAFAKAIYNGTASYHLPIEWSTPEVVGSFSQPITGDALVAATNGGTIVVAVSSGGSTWVFESPNDGDGWPGMTPSPLPGSAPGLALGEPGVLVTTVDDSGVLATTLSSHGYGAPSVTFSVNAVAEAPVWAAGIASGALGVAVATSGGTVDFYRSTDNGYRYTVTTIGSYEGASASSSIFNSVGGTRLTDPHAAPGSLTAVAEGPNVFVLYTSDLAGRVVANVTTSPDGGVNWNPPMTYQLPIGSLAEPEAVASGAGYVYVTWTDDSLGTTAVDQAVFLPDGRIIQQAQPLPGTGSRLDSPASQPVVAVDPFMRPVYVWLSTSPSSAPVLQVSGAFLKPLDATNLTNAAFEQLTAWDFSPSSSSHQTTQSATTASFESNVTKLDAALRDPNPIPCYPSDAQNATALLYHGDTAFPLIYDSTPSSACANLAPAETPASNVSSAGVLAPSTYLSVLTDWIFEGEGVQVDYRGDALAAALDLGINPDPSSTGLPPIPGPETTQSHSTTIDGQSASASVTLWPLNPTTGSIDSSVSFPFAAGGNFHSVVCGVVNYRPIYETWTNTSETVGYSWSITVEGYSHTYSSAVPAGGGWNLPSSIYLTNLTPNAGISWSTGNLQATYDNFYHYFDACTGTAWTRNTGYAATGSIPGFSGTLYTSLAMHPSAPGSTFIRATPDGSSHENLTYLWNNTMPASASISLSGSSTWSTNQWSIPESHQFTNIPTGSHYTTSINVQSQTGAWNSTQEPSVSAGEDTYANPLGSSFGCTFPLENNPVRMDGQPWVVTDPSANKATVIWNSTADGPSWLQYYELGVGLNWSQTAIANATGPTVGGVWYQYQYTVELQGIPPFALFGLTAWTSYVADPGCISYANTSSAVFLTPGGFSLSEWDHPYDSITGEGGGASIEWNVAPGFVSNGQLLSGTLFYQNDTSTPTTVVAPIVSSVGLTQYGTTYVYNVSLPQLNTTYTAWVELNYSVHWGTIHNATFTIVSSPHTFVYQQDTSGDGLTNLEKVLGWTVTTTDLSGRTANQWVSANPNDWATNGLVNDYVEKQFGLNPGTLDSAGSHMLDTWNLTFQLTSLSAVQAACSSSEFRCWYENGSNPFSYAVTPGGSPPPNDKPVATNSTSNAHWTRAGLQDDAPYDAEVLWTGGAVGVLEGLIASENVGWLRGVVMHGFNPGSGAVWTLTVWGKLSWGANPLSQSTIGDGIPDGSQPNPLLREVLQITIGSWSANLSSSNDEAAPFIEVSSGRAGSGQDYYGGFGPALKGSTVSTATPYEISVPVVSASQFAYFNISIADNTSSSGTNWYQRQVYDSPAVDLLGQSATLWRSGSLSGASLKVHWTVLRVSAAASTLLWAPANNTTLSVLPWGLKRYSAEPDFDLIVLNLTSAATVSSIAGAEGGWTYSVHLDAGLNNLLVPRGAFLSSPLGQALLNNTNENVSRTGSGVTFHPTDWSGRTETSASNPVPSSANGWNPSYIWVFSTTSQAQNGSASGFYGGLPSNPAVESAQGSLQVQSVIWVNVSSGGYGGLTSANAELEDLFGGLVLNASGNLTGNILSVTSELGTLGLPANVRAAMANVSLPNDGAYAAPQYQQPPPSPSFWQQVGDAIWNTVSGIAGAIGVTKLISVVWNAIQAAAAYVGQAAAWLSSHLGITKLLNQAWTTLKSIASAMEWALQQLLTFVKQAIQALISAAIAGWRALISTFVAGLNSSLTQAEATVSAGHTITKSESSAIWQALGGSIWLIGIVAAVALEIAIGLATVVSFGLSDLALLVIGVLVSVTLSLLWPNLGSTLASVVISKIEGFVNGTRNQAPNQAEWTAFGQSVNWIDDGVTGPVAAYELSSTVSSKGAHLLTKAVAFTMALIAIVLDVYATTNGYPQWLGVAAALTAGLSVFVDVIGIAQDKSDPATTPLDFAIDGVVVALDGLVAYETLTNVL